ncbi:antibiotic biosynthesis monooxygenase [Streptomyces sp. SID1328]|uniref:putative quinol monooxygenase n=1 Tax=Streptomyces sp. SID1328 TaxID=2690250 RepID=UPI001371C29D|nr:antibiotic biosynthesis monooxygenase [Streptomyces sp. SID1328]MYV43625.1 antibiotic biosynthesis monooxygenase [Streptomyces sp. SID1328]
MADVKVGLYVYVEAKPGKEEEVADFLRQGLDLVREEPDTVAWFAVRLSATGFAIFDAFPTDSARQTHLSGRLGSALMERASELFSQPPSIERLDVLAHKLP